MSVKSGLFLFLLTVLQVTARYKSVESDFIENEIISEPLLSSSSRIMSGWLAERGQFPYHASLRFDAFDDNGIIVRYCGGAIISNEWVVTSAFCSDNTTYNFTRAVVHAGGLISHESEYAAITTEWYNHPLFQRLSPELQANDISLVKLQQPVVYTRFVQPIRIQSSADANRDYDGQQVIAIGNGHSGHTGSEYEPLRWVYLRAISNNECSRLYSNGVLNTTICVQYFDFPSQATCFGDNGGPLVHVDSDGIPTLIGVSLYYSVGCATDLPEGFIRPGHFLPWFQEVTGINFDRETTTTSTTTTTTTTTTDSEEQEPDGVTPEDNTVAPPEDSEDKEEDKEDDSDCLESNEDDELGQLIKRLQVLVKVKVRFDKYNLTNAVGNEIVAKH